MGCLECCATMGDLIVGFPNSIECVYTVGKYGIDDGGKIKILRAGITDWENIQTENPTATGYTTVRTTGSAEVKILNQYDSSRPYENAIYIKVENGCLFEGDKVTLVLGDTSKGSAGILTQTIAEENHMIIASIDVYGGNSYKHVMPPQYLTVKNAVCARIDIVLPSLVDVNKEFISKIRAVDMYGNRCKDFVGEIIIDAPDNFNCPSVITLSKEDKGAKEVNCLVKSEGDYILAITNPSLELSSKSNICKASLENEYKLFWGDMHAQNGLASGIGSMDNTLSFAKEIGCLDFASWQGNDFEISDKNWSVVCEAIKKYHQPHNFITFLGYEWSGIHSGGGDYNIYYLNDDEKIHRSSMWYYRDKNTLDSSGKENDGSDCYPISELWKHFKGRDDVMAIPHVGGRFGNFDYHQEDMTSVIEVHSHHGIFDWYIEDAMKKGMKVGFIATSDDHTSRVGLSYPVGAESADFGASFDVISGLTAVYAKELTREGIWEAIKSRRCYGTTNSRTIVKFNVNDAFMGEETEISSPPKIEFEVDANSVVDRVEIYRGTDKIYTFSNNSYNESSNKQRVKIVWSGVKTKFRKKSVLWKGKIFVSGGRIASAENYSIDREGDGIQWKNNQILSFVSKTSGDEDGVILDVISSPNEDTNISFLSNQLNTTVSLKDIKFGEVTIPTGVMDCKVVFSIEGDTPNTSLHYTGSYIDENFIKGNSCYYIKVFLKDGNRAWVSPVFTQYK